MSIDVSIEVSIDAYLDVKSFNAYLGMHHQIDLHYTLIDASNDASNDHDE